MPTKSYHYSDGQNSFGPIPLEELRMKQIGPNTLIWSEDLVTWTKAQDVAELADLFTSANSANHPPIPPKQITESSFPNTNNPSAPYLRPPKTYLIESIITTIICCWIFGIPSIVYASRVEKKFYAGDIAGAESDSKNAKKWIIINLVACAAVWLLGIGIFGLGLISGAFQ
ncbi:CD225/dispanin family protein [Sphingobacterium faecale]|uniref:CD225/dispanin family protein n=1 Tax=Sphingobacterium faecale TaxID=2803775 RepID=A0ABS1R4N0_9SPHI|nr:CD225/dispanin family protein [Sphingobacterium faecale]MBL1409670.1 CD225/dispanin family protein [Sphingobacterium faecale]